MDHKKLLEGTYLGNKENTIIAYAYDELGDDTVARLMPLKVADGAVLVILLNPRLPFDKEYCDKVKRAMPNAERNMMREVEGAGLNLGSLLLRYLAASVDYGHVDPEKTTDICVSDFGGWAGQCMWREVYADVQKILLGKPKTAYAGAQVNSD